MVKASTKAWLEAVLSRPGGDILAVQTLRNAIMAASVLASAALVAQMAVLAGVKNLPIWLAWSMALDLASCASLAVWAIVGFAQCGFQLQSKQAEYLNLAKQISLALFLIQASAVLLIVAMVFAAISVF